MKLLQLGQMLVGEPEDAAESWLGLTSVLWGVLGAWANALAMAVAAVFAALAWHAQVRAAREGAKRAVGDSAVAHAAAAIGDLTTGPVARSRRRVADWTTAHAAHLTSAGRAPIRDGLVGTHADTEMRDDVFVLLWSLQRLGPLAEDLAFAQSSQRKVLTSHVDLMTTSLSRFVELLAPDERRLFRESVNAATDSLIAVASSIDELNFDQKLEWALVLSKFSLEVLEDSSIVDPLA